MGKCLLKLRFPCFWSKGCLEHANQYFHPASKKLTLPADELSMHLAIGLVLYQVFSFDKPPAQKRRVLSIILGVLVPFFIYHSVADEFVLHVVLFFIMSVTVSYKTQSVIKERVKNPIDRKKMGRLAKFATSKLSPQSLCHLSCSLAIRGANNHISQPLHWYRTLSGTWRTSSARISLQPNASWACLGPFSSSYTAGGISERQSRLIRSWR